jgi:hypothetical protein
MSFLNMVFGCSHKNLSFPITVRGARSRNMAASVTGTYVVCLSCGREFPYDWNQMKVVRDSRAASPRGAMATEPGRAA